METFGIFGHGRFGSLWAELLSRFGEVYVYEPLPEKRVDHNERLHFCESPQEIYASANIIFYAVPISAFEAAVKEHAHLMTHLHIICDLLSVKLHAKSVFDEHLPQHVEAMLLHPMFGPDSVKAHGLTGLPIVVDKYKTSPANYDKVTALFKALNLKIIEMSADKHDRLAARSQGVAHFVGRMLQEFGFESTNIDTMGAKKLHEIMELSCNDTWQLFTDLLTKNPYTAEMRDDLEEALQKVSKKLTS